LFRHFSGIFGNILEHYDAALFGFLAPFLAPLFFPEHDPIQALIYTYALLPLGCLSRPIGAIFFGKMGDRIGRRKTLALSLFGMAISTGMVAFLPIYEEIGIAAPILLGLLRLLQNFFSAGEITGAAIYILEDTGEKKQCLWSSFFDASGILGILIASAATGFFQESWRILFLAGSFTGIAGAMVRWKGGEILVKKDPEPAYRILWRHKMAVASIAAVAGFSYANYYLLTNFMNGFLPLVSSITKVEAIQANTFLLIGDFILLPLFGLLAMKLGKEKLMMSSLAASIALTIPLLGLLKGCAPGIAIAVRVCLALIGIGLAAPFHAWALEAAPRSHRYLVGALGTAIGAKLIGAPIPAMALWLYQKTGWIETAAFPVIASAILAWTAMSRRKPVFALEKD